MATCLYPPPRSHQLQHHHNNNSNTRHVPLDSFYSPAALANSSSSFSLISSSSSISIYSSNILIGLDISSPVRREQEHDQEQGQEQEQEQEQDQEQEQAQEQQEQEYLPDFFVPRPQSAQVPLERPRIPRLAQRRHRKNMTDMIGTTTAAEFDELPIAVRRKYFSTLERLRLAHDSGSITTANDLDPPVSRKRSLAERRHLRTPLIESHHTNSSATSSPRRLRKSSRAKSITAADASWFLSLPDKIRRKQFTKEEQIRLAGKRDSVILDAADEAIYKASRRNRNITPLGQAPFPSSRISMESSRGGMASERPSSMALAMAESFRWMDEDPDLDLRLVLDDYHANLPDVVIPTQASSFRPSFRRHMSITKVPFGRPSLSSPTRSTSSTNPFPPTHSRQRSRAVSLISPRLASSLYGDDAPRPSIDPHATHYQDPEARLKLRVYLASPQKFDEAIEFGFPSTDGILDPSSFPAADPDSAPTPAVRLARSHALQSTGLSDTSHTFFDDGGSLLDDDASMGDPESPRTPHDATFRDHAPQHARLLSLADERRPPLHRHADSYSLSAAGSREMTLRMTLTRPDLRSDADSMYGWQGARSKSPLATESVDGEAQGGMRGPFEGPDGWGALGKDDGVVKRLWNRVRRERKTSSNFGH